jgi:hypothetical protein
VLELLIGHAVDGTTPTATARSCWLRRISAVLNTDECGDHRVSSYLGMSRSLQDSLANIGLSAR